MTAARDASPVWDIYFSFRGHFSNSWNTYVNCAHCMNFVVDPATHRIASKRVINRVSKMHSVCAQLQNSKTIRKLEPKCYLSVVHARETDEMLQRMQYPQLSARKKCTYISASPIWDKPLRFRGQFCMLKTDRFIPHRKP